MPTHVALLIVALLIILAGSSLFTNALEHVGSRLSLSEGLVGSVLAAVATALPETLVPIVAVLSGGHDPGVRERIGIGAIIGSPLMLSTLAMALMGIFAGAKRGWKIRLAPERSGLQRDFLYFCIAFAVAAAALFIPPGYRSLRLVVTVAMIGAYIVYVAQTIRASGQLVDSGHETAADRGLALKQLGIPHNPWIESLQLLFGLVLIVVGARLFVDQVEAVAGLTGVSALLLSLLIIPIATEMPEKVNSVLWIRRGRDTLAFGNITGAMVFQGTLLPAFGVQLASWRPEPPTLIAIGLTLGASLWTALMFRRGTITPLHLLVNGFAYALFFALVA